MWYNPAVVGHTYAMRTATRTQTGEMDSLNTARELRVKGEENRGGQYSGMETI